MEAVYIGAPYNPNPQQEGNVIVEVIDYDFYDVLYFADYHDAESFMSEHYKLTESMEYSIDIICEYSDEEYDEMD